MKYLYLIFAIFILVACNLASPTAPPPNSPTATNIPATSIPPTSEISVSSTCQYIQPAVGPGITGYAAPNLNSTNLGTLIYDDEYIVIASQDGVDDKDAARIFYQVQHLATGDIAWVISGIGERFAGDCSAFE